MFKESQPEFYSGRQELSELGGTQREAGPIFKLKNFEKEIQTQDEKEIVANEIDKILKRAGKDISTENELFAQMEHFEKTTHDRKFFVDNRKGGAIMQMLYNLMPNNLNSEECRRYFAEKFDNKTIYVFGGGDSMQDLLNSNIVHPNEVINFDPFLKNETITKNSHGIYRSYNESASDLIISSNIKDGKLNKPDQILCDISTPYYLDSGDDIRKLFVNILYALNDGGEARIYPIALQNIETKNGNFQSRKNSFMQIINGLAKDPNFNIKIFEPTEDGHTLLIQKVGNRNII